MPYVKGEQIADLDWSGDAARRTSVREAFEAAVPNNQPARHACFFGVQIDKRCIAVATLAGC